MAQDAKPQRNQLAQSLMMRLLSGGGGGDPYANERSGPFAQSPRIQPTSSPARAAPPRTAAAGGGGGGGGSTKIPVPATKPKQGAGKGGGGGKKKSSSGPNNMPLPGNATSPSSLVQSPEMNATSPSSLMVNPGTPYNQVMPNPPGVPPVPQSLVGQDRASMPGGPGGGTMTGQAPPGGPGGGTFTGQPPPMPARPFSPTPPTAALNMASGAGSGMGGNPFNVPSPENLALHQAATGMTTPSTIAPPHMSSPAYYNRRPNKLAMPPPYGGPMAAADQAPHQNPDVIRAILAGLGGG